MQKEGTGKPRTPDIALSANVKMRELSFEKVPDPDVRFWGSTSRNSVWGSWRENLPDGVQAGVVYRNAEVRLFIASEIVDSDPDLLSNLNKEGEKTYSEHRRQKTVEQETESR